MTPDEALATLRSWLEQYEPETYLEARALNAFAQLDEQLTSGGELPKPWRAVRANTFLEDIS